MKIFYQIFVIIFVCASLFIIRNDVKLLYDHTVAYVSEHMHPSSSKTTNDIVTTATDAVSNFIQSIHTPGALRGNSDIAPSAKVVILSSKEVIALTNKSRASNGNLPALLENTKLNQSAQIKLNDMFDKQYFEHVSPSGVQIKDLAGTVSYEFISIGENLALGNFKNNQALVSAWMASPGHRANILNTQYTEIGVAVGHRMFDGVDTWIAVQHFGLPRTACPTTDEVLHGIILLDEKEIAALEQDLTERQSKINSGALYQGKTTEEQVNEYNSLVEKHNRLAEEIQQKIADYNKGVRDVKACFTAKASVAK